MSTEVSEAGHASHEPAASPDVPATGPDRVALRAGAVAGGAVAAATAALVAINPSDSGMAVCWSQSLFGIDCPFCGGLRCANALARGDWLAAADHNVVLAVALPLVAVGWVIWMVAAWRGRRLRMPNVPPWLIAAGVVALIGFTVARNLDLNGVTVYLGSTASAG